MANAAASRGQGKDAAASAPTMDMPGKAPRQGSVAKEGIFDPELQRRILAAADPRTELVPIWLMMTYGTHPKNIRQLGVKHLQEINGEMKLRYKRAKNDAPQSWQVPDDMLPALRTWLLVQSGKDPDQGPFPTSRQTLWKMCRDVGRRVGLKDMSPMTLRHTACANWLRELQDNPDRIKIVSRLMGATEAVVTQNYINLDQWTKLGQSRRQQT